MENVYNKTLAIKRNKNKKWYNEMISSSEDNNAKLFTKIAKRKCGKFCKEFDKYGFICGMTLGDDDFYWLIINEDRTITYSSAVGYPDLYESDELPSSLYILNYLLDNQPGELLAIIKKSLKRNSDYLFTKIYLKNKSYNLYGNTNSRRTKKIHTKNKSTTS